MVLPIIAAKIAAGVAGRVGVRGIAAAARGAARTVASRLVTKVAPLVGQFRAKATMPWKVIPTAALPARTLPVVARAPTALKAAVSKAAVGMVERPFRTALPYAATAGMLGAVSRVGEKKAVTGVERGATIGQMLAAPTALPTGLGGTMAARTVGEVPIMAPQIIRSWTTGTTDFAVDSEGRHWVLTKRGWKKYTPKKPIVLGTKHLTPKKFIAAAKKYYGLKKDLDKVFKVVRKKK